MHELDWSIVYVCMLICGNMLTHSHSCLCHVHFCWFFFNDRLPLWPYTKGAITVLLVLPYFGGASYLYKHFIRPYISDNSVIWKWNIFSIQRINGFNSGEDNYPDVVDKNVIRTEPQKSEGAVIFKVSFQTYICDDCTLKLFMSLVHVRTW